MGENRLDAHDYLDNVYDKGCRFFIVERKIFNDKNDVLEFVVSDSVLALGYVAKLYRQKFNIPFIAITGSCGKTTCKDITSHLLSYKYKTLKTQGNLNNEIGVPKTIFTLSRDDEIVVLETAMNHAGEISNISNIIEPDFMAINNIEPAHIEFFKDGIEGIARAKAEIFSHANENATALINKDTNCVEILLSEAKRYKVKNIETFSLSEISEIKNKSFVYKGITFFHNLRGRFNLCNIILALKIAEHYKTPICECADRLLNFKPSKNRMERILIRGGIVINDTYNSNPTALKETLFSLSEEEAKTKIAVIGDMLELGEMSEHYHKEIGKFINTLDIDVVYTIGEKTKHTHEEVSGKNKKHFSDMKNIYEELKSEIKNDVVVLIKASRGSNLDILVGMLEGDQ